MRASVGGRRRGRAMQVGYAAWHWRAAQWARVAQRMLGHTPRVKYTSWGTLLTGDAVYYGPVPSVRRGGNCSEVSPAKEGMSFTKKPSRDYQSPTSPCLVFKTGNKLFCLNSKKKTLMAQNSSSNGTSKVLKTSIASDLGAIYRDEAFFRSRLEYSGVLEEHMLEIRLLLLLGMEREETERIFQVMQCTNREKVVLATIQFTKDARAWWKATSAHLPNVGELEWAGFLEMFRGKYFSERVKEKKAVEFAALKQKRMSVAEYEAQFAWLAVPIFIEKLGPHNIQTYTEMVQRAQLVEDTMAKVEGIKGKDISKPTSIKRGLVDTTGTFQNNNNNNHYNNNKRPTTGKDYGMEKKIKVEETMMVEYCKFCNKPGHQVDKCWKKAGACLRWMSFRTCWGRVEELLVARELWIDHKKLIFFPLFVCYDQCKPSPWSRPKAVATGTATTAGTGPGAAAGTALAGVEDTTPEVPAVAAVASTTDTLAYSDPAARSVNNLCPAGPALLPAAQTAPLAAAPTDVTAAAVCTDACLHQ
ncbi:hypothetical protein Taro_035054 [Colocasia esculenta]|uniref:Retrotransposon gag domain-containing protein n=1 Tax=Colocasia esculenta TaxID=4460 RepID=A0A843W2M4_COLES|nr:hypothetical protein [Colocasia esculenta]